MGGNSKSDVDRISRLVTRISKNMIEGFEEESAWTMVRVALPNELYDIPRWHPDGSYFKSSKKVYKLVMSLKGPQTLFGEKINVKKYDQLSRKSGENVEANIIKNNNPKKFKKEDLRIRKEIIKVVKKTKVCKKGQAGIYLVGDKDAAIHSEPKMNAPRIFISILVGSKAQIKEWESKGKK